MVAFDEASHHLLLFCFHLQHIVDVVFPFNVLDRIDVDETPALVY